MMAFTPQDPDSEKRVLIEQALFEELVELIEARDKKPLTIEWGPAHMGTVTYWEPVIYVAFDPEDADPLTVGQDG